MCTGQRSRLFLTMQNTLVSTCSLHNATFFPSLTSACKGCVHVQPALCMKDSGSLRISPPAFHN